MVALMEPMLIAEGSRHRGDLIDLAVEVAAASAGFRRSDAAITIEKRNESTGACDVPRRPKVFFPFFPNGRRCPRNGRGIAAPHRRASLLAVALTPFSRRSIVIVETAGGVLMQVRVQKWGNSLAVRIPKPLAEDAKVEEGTVLNLAVSEGKVVATPVKKSKQSLKQMLAKVSRKNLHAEIESGAPVGREVW